MGHHFDGLVHERRNSSALAMELRLSCTNPSICLVPTHYFCPITMYLLLCVGIDMKVILQETFKISIIELYLNIAYLTLQPHLPRTKNWTVSPCCIFLRKYKKYFYIFHHFSILRWGWNTEDLNLPILTHWGPGKIAAISQTTVSNAFNWMKMYEFRLRFHWDLFLRFYLTIFQHWFR